ncbi:MAG: MotA/TolQ/ExbB proton channel family protein [Prevotella sp.]|nr:MotA/TolQ/ExbB proton channel family protein [Prevotella sp.]
MRISINRRYFFYQTMILIAMLLLKPCMATAQEADISNRTDIEQPVKEKGDTSDNRSSNLHNQQTDSLFADSLSYAAAEDSASVVVAPVENEGIFKSLKKKFIDGTPEFMSLVAMALILGLAFCIERIIYLTLSTVNTKKMLTDIDAKIAEGDIEGAKEICRNTRGPVASICYQGLIRIDESIDNIERSITAYGTVQAANLEKGCSWITLFIAMAPSLGFLGTVIGMVMAFDQIQTAGDISPTIVAAGMKVALITTIFGIIVALILQLFYNYILTKIEQLTAEMEESAIALLDAIVKFKLRNDTK